MEADPALPPSRPSGEHAEQHAQSEHKGAHDYTNGSQDPRISCECDPSRVRVLVLVLPGPTIRRS